jgi:hypothetical protein
MQVAHDDDYTITLRVTAVPADRAFIPLDYR